MQSSPTHSPLAGHRAVVLVLGLVATVLAMAAFNPAPATAQSCTGTLKSVAGGTGRGAANNAAYSFTCDVAVSEYRLTPNGPTFNVHDVGQGFNCQPDEDNPDNPEFWECTGSAPPGTPITGTLATEEDPCGSRLTLDVTVAMLTRFSLVACGGGGGGGGGGTAPTISALRLSPSTFRAASRGGSVATAVGTRVSYRLSAAARTTFTVEHAVTGIKSGSHCVAPTRRNRRGRHCTRYLKLRGSFTHSGRTGANSLRFTGRLSGRKLAAGTYRLAVTARTSAGRTSKAVRSAQFHIKR